MRRARKIGVFRRPAFVYRLYSENQELLYVGVTHDFDKRIHGHKSKPWYRHVAAYTLERYESRYSGLHAEKLAIYEEQPTYNVAGKVPGNIYFIRSMQKIRAKRLKRLQAKAELVAGK